MLSENNQTNYLKTIQDLKDQVNKTIKVGRIIEQIIYNRNVIEFKMIKMISSSN